MKASVEEGGEGGGLITFSEKVGSKENQKRKGSNLWANCYLASSDNSLPYHFFYSMRPNLSFNVQTFHICSSR